MRYPVRCCCQSQKIFGYIDLPRADGRNEEQIQVPLRSTVRAENFTPSEEGPATEPTRTATVLLRQFVDTKNGIDEIAVYSDDRPIECWRSVVGFTEMKPMMRFTIAGLARDLAAEDERMRRRFIHHTRPNRPLSMKEAMELGRRMTGDPVQSFDAKRVADQVRYVSHPSAMPVLIAFSRDILRSLWDARDQDANFQVREIQPPTFLGVEIVEDPELAAGTFDIYTDAEAAAHRLIVIKQDRNLVARDGIEPSRPPL